MEVLRCNLEHTSTIVTGLEPANPFSKSSAHFKAPNKALTVNTEISPLLNSSSVGAT